MSAKQLRKTVAERDEKRIRAIETRYNGYRFRSRLEARWAVFFDTMNAPYSYEYQGYILTNEGPYLPDFLLLRSSLFVEVKPEIPSDEAVCKIVGLAVETHCMTSIVSLLTNKLHFLVIPHEDATPSNQMILFLGFQWAECPLCHTLAMLCTEDLGPLRSVTVKRPWLRCLNDTCVAYTNACHAKLDKFDPTSTTRIRSAYESALSSRFEFGETPRGPKSLV